MKFLFLGSGTSHGVPVIGCDCAVCTSADPRNKRTRVSALVRTEGASLLIDTPPDFRAQMLRHNIARFDAVLMTHSHADHLFGMDDVRIICAREKRAMPIYGNAETLRTIREKFDYVFRDEGKAFGWEIPRLELREIMQTSDVFGIPVTPVPIHHACWTIHGYRIGGLAYLTDCSGIPETSLPLLEGLDTLVIGAIRHEPHRSHFAVYQALEAIERIKPRRAFLTHISHRLDHVETEAALPPHVRLAYDGLELEVPGP